MNYDWIWDAGKVARCCYHCRGCCCYCCWWFWQYHGYMFASCLHHDSIMFAMMFVDVVHSSHIGCFDLCYVYHVFFPKTILANDHWMKTGYSIMHAGCINHPCMHRGCSEPFHLFRHWGSQLHWLSGERSGAGLGQRQVDLAIQWVQKNGDTSVGTKKWGYLWTYTYIIYQLIVIWFNFFLALF